MMNTTSQKMSVLLAQCWSSPLFGDSYGAQTHFPAFERRMAAVRRSLVRRLYPILVRGMPEAKPAAVKALVLENAAKVVAFCAGLGVELDDLQRLSAAAVCFGLLYWGDALMDSGDRAMLAAVDVWSGNAPVSFPGAPPPAPALLQARLEALREISANVSRLALPEDRQLLVEQPFLGFLGHSAKVRRLSLRYLRARGQARRAGFWRRHAEELARSLITSNQVLGASAVIYALYRQRDPALPPVAEIFQERGLQEVLGRLGNAALRVFDDIGDRESDTGQRSTSELCLNLFNQPARPLIRAFLNQAGLEDSRAAARVRGAFQARNRQGDAAILSTFVKLLRQRVAALPGPLRRRYSVFLMIAKRYMECGFINCLGDAALADRTAAQPQPVPPNPWSAT